MRYNLWNAINHNLAGQVEGGISLSNADHVGRLRTRLHLLNRFDRFSNEGESILREKQMNVYADIHASLERDENEMSVKAPTGFGKTVIFNQITKAADVPTLIVVPSQKLVEQTYERFKQFTPEIDVGRVYGKEKEYGRKVTITTYQSLVSDEGKLIHPDGIGLVILDEFHEGTSEKRINAFEAVEHFGNAAILGLSATPVEIQDPKSTDTRVGKMSQNMVHEISEKEAVEEGYIAPFTAVRVEVGVDLTEVRINSSGQYDEKELEKRINTVSQNQAAVEFFLQVRARDRQMSEGQAKVPRPLTTSLYASSVAHSQELAREFAQVGVKAAAVWGNQPVQEREEILRQWEAGEIEVVCSKDYLVRGVDIPAIRLVMNVAPTMSEIVEKQRSGRGLRLDPNNPDKHTIIADFIYENANKRHLQVTYPQLLDSAHIVRKTVKGSSSMDSERENLPSFNDITIEGLRIISHPEEVMVMMRKSLEGKYKQIPEEWEAIGIYAKSGISGQLGRSIHWIKARLPQVISQIQSERELNGVPIDEQDLLYGDFLDSTKHVHTYYAPEVVNRLRDISEKNKFAPEGWLEIGTTDSGIAGILQKSPGWVRSHLPRVISTIQEEQEAAGIAADLQIPLFDEFISKGGHLRTHFAPAIIDRLRDKTERLQPPPEGWKVVGKKASGIAGEIGRSNKWIFDNIPAVIAQIQRESEAQGIPLEQQEPLSGEYLVRNGVAIHYAPAVTERLQAIVASEKPAPENWMALGTGKSGITGELGKSNNWVTSRIPAVIAQLQRRQEDEELPVSEQRSYVGSYLDQSNQLRTFYSSEVIEKLREML